MTEPGKNALGLVGFPTPDEAADTSAYLLFLFNDPTYAQWLLGALEPLVYEYSWYKSGDLEPEEASELFRLIIQQAPYNLLPQKLPTPFWDENSGDDADDEQPITDQPWYGEIQVMESFTVGDEELTFVEDAFIWVVAGLIAYSGQVGAAIAFVPIARKFVITVKSNPLGGIIQFLQDAVEIGRVDTYSATDVATSANVVMDTSGSPTLWVRLLPDNPHDLESVSATVMRSRLSEDDFSNPNQRYNADCDCIQVTPDGGATWNDSPGSDPRHSPAWLKPPVAGSNKRCDSAANKVKWLKDFIDALVYAAEVAGLIATVVNTALEFIDLLIPAADFIDLLVEFAATVLGAGGAAIDAAFSSDQYDLLLCIFYCNSDANGQVSADQLIEVEAEITAQLNTTAALITNSILFIQGEVGLSNAGAIGSETGDCSACDCCDTCSPIDLTATDLCWLNVRGSWSLGTGLQSTFDTNPAQLNDVAVAQVAPPSGTLVSTVAFNWNAGAVGDGALVIISGVSGGVGTELLRTSISAGSGTATVSGSFDYTAYNCVLVTSQFDSGTYAGYITEISLTCE